MNGLDKAGSTPLHWAAHGGHVESMELLLAVANCEINVQVSSIPRVIILNISPLLDRSSIFY